MLNTVKGMFKHDYSYATHKGLPSIELIDILPTKQKYIYRKEKIGTHCGNRE
jgi:hypothetical protein